MADHKDKRDELRDIDIADSGHAYENRQEIYYNDNVGGRAVFVDSKEQYVPDEPYNDQVFIPEKTGAKHQYSRSRIWASTSADLLP